jgi:hypothetical protein
MLCDAWAMAGRRQFVEESILSKIMDLTMAGDTIRR